MLVRELLAEAKNHNLEAPDKKTFVVVKVTFDYERNDNYRPGFAYAVFDFANKADAEAFAKTADQLDWNDNDDYINHMAQNVYDAESGMHGDTDSVKIKTTEPKGAKYFSLEVSDVKLMKD